MSEKNCLHPWWMTVHIGYLWLMRPHGSFHCSIPNSFQQQAPVPHRCERPASVLTLQGREKKMQIKNIEGSIQSWFFYTWEGRFSSKDATIFMEAVCSCYSVLMSKGGRRMKVSTAPPSNHTLTAEELPSGGISVFLIHRNAHTDDTILWLQLKVGH